MQRGDLGCLGIVGAPRVQPLNDYRLLFMVKKGLDTYLKNNKVRPAQPSPAQPSVLPLPVQTAAKGIAAQRTPHSGLPTPLMLHAT